MLFSEVVDRLHDGLVNLPGPAAQAMMAPRPRRQWPAGWRTEHIRDAAGLLLVFPHGDHAHIVLTVRSDSVRHGGQVSLPGGAVDPGESFEAAALREAREEIGLATAHVTIVGALTPLDIPISGFRLHPILGITDGKPPLLPSDGEVARILYVNVDELLARESVSETERQRDGLQLSIPGFHLQGVEIWGATAMILAEFLFMLGWRAGNADQKREDAERS